MKVLLIHDYLDTYGGAERVLEGFIKMFPDFEIITSYFDPTIFPTDSLIFQNKEKIYYPKILNLFKHNKIHRYLSSLYFIILKIKTEKYDYIVINTSGPASLSNLRKYDNSFVYYHKLPSFILHSKKLLRTLINLFKSNIKKYNKIVLNSDFNRNLFIQNVSVDIDKLYVAYPFIDNINIEHSEKKDQFVFVGRLEVYKGIKDIVNTFVQNSRELIVIGKGSLIKDLPKVKNIKYLGYVNDEMKQKYISESIALINLAGEREEFGIVFAESVALGTKIVCKHAGAINEITNTKNLHFVNNNLAEVINNLHVENSSVDIADSKEVLNKFSYENFRKSIYDIISL